MRSSDPQRAHHRQMQWHHLSFTCRALRCAPRLCLALCPVPVSSRLLTSSIRPGLLALRSWLHPGLTPSSLCACIALFCGSLDLLCEAASMRSATWMAAQSLTGSNPTAWSSCALPRWPSMLAGVRPRSGPITHITWANVIFTMGLHSVYERGWLDSSETVSCRRACRWLLFSTCFGTPPRVYEEVGSEESFMQSDCEAAREVGASPDPSWHSDSDVSDATNTTASTPRESALYGYNGTRVGGAQNPGPTTSSAHTVEPATSRSMSGSSV